MVRVMIVDDEVPIRQWLEFCIGKMDGYQVSGTASNGAEGYSLFRKTLPDIIISDIRMPVMDGLEMLKLIRNINPAVASVILTSHEDFEYARKAMKFGASEYILKTEITEDGLKKILDKIRDEIGADSQENLEKTFEELSYRNRYLRSLVLSRSAGAVTEKVLNEYGIPIRRGEYAAIDIMTGEDDFSRFKISEKGFFSHVIKVPLDMNHMMIVGNILASAGPSTVKKQDLMEQCCRTILSQGKCRIGCSDIYSDLARLGQAMRQAYDRAQLGFYYPGKTLFSTESVEKRRTENGEIYKIRFSRELVNQQFSKAVEIRDAMMREVRAEKTADIDYIKKLYLFFLTSLYHTTKDDVNQVEEELGELGRQIHNAVSLDQLDQVMERGFQSSGKQGMENAEYSASVRNAIYFMEQHYPESLTLADVADHVGLSSEYLSRLFREETGVKFVVYLNNLRLKHALRLLETTNLKVYEIAEKVGYSNLSYFSTVFKKNFGQNPFDYKNSANLKL